MESQQNLKEILIRELSLLSENIQLADKIYFSTGKLSPEEKEYILGITDGDVTTKIISDMYYNAKYPVISDYMKKYYTSEESLKILSNDLLKDLKEHLPNIHKQLKTYDKNVFPIKDFDILNRNNNDSIDPYTFEHRQKLLDNIDKLPSIAVRNLKGEIRKERTGIEINKYNEQLEYFLLQLSHLSNREPSMLEQIYKKLFKSGATLDSMIDFTEEKRNLIGGVPVTKEEIKEIIEDHPDLNKVYEQGNVMVIEVYSPEGIKAIGCTSLWCFTYGNDQWRNWNNDSTNDMIYAIVDFNEDTDSQYFMQILVRPIPTEEEYNEIEEEEGEVRILFDMTNQETHPHTIYNMIPKEKADQIFTFE